LVGGELFVWIVSRIPGQLLRYDPIKLALGVVVYGAMIVPGLLVFWMGQVLLESLGVRIWKPVETDSHGGPERRCPPEHEEDAE
jgi:hypothetical protein